MINLVNSTACSASVTGLRGAHKCVVHLHLHDCIYYKTVIRQSKLTCVSVKLLLHIRNAVIPNLGISGVATPHVIDINLEPCGVV